MPTFAIKISRTVRQQATLLIVAPDEERARMSALFNTPMHDPRWQEISTGEVQVDEIQEATPR